MTFMRSGNRWVEQIKTVTLLLGIVFMLPVSAQLTQPASWQSSLLTDHELVGRVWRTSTESFISLQELQSDIESARYLFLGEKHDNPDHHFLQLALLEYLGETQQLGSVTFEMLDSNADRALAELYTDGPATHADLQEYLSWDDEGWPWQFYGPLVEHTFRAGLPILAGNISRDSISMIYADGEAEAPQVLSEPAIEQLHVDIDESHCGMLPESQFPAMVRVQQARDQAMANKLLAPNDGELSVLIAGNYHVRQDLGVPNYLLAMESGLARDAILALTFMEVQPDSTDPADYLDSTGDQPAYDYLWFTPAVQASDYCESFQ